MARARDESSPLFAGNAAGTLRLIFYLALAMVLMVLDQRNGWLWRLRYGAAAVVEPVKSREPPEFPMMSWLVTEFWDPEGTR